MSEKYNTIVEEAKIPLVIDAFGAGTGWDGNPHTIPDYTMKAWFIDPYWYVVTSDGIYRAISNDQTITLDDLVYTVGEQMRLLTLPELRKPIERKV